MASSSLIDFLHIEP